jgi:hypothetical protein
LLDAVEQGFTLRWAPFVSLLLEQFVDVWVSAISAKRACPGVDWRM